MPSNVVLRSIIDPIIQCFNLAAASFKSSTTTKYFQSSYFKLVAFVGPKGP